MANNNQTAPSKLRRYIHRATKRNYSAEEEGRDISKGRRNERKHSRANAGTALHIMF